MKRVSYFILASFLFMCSGNADAFWPWKDKYIAKVNGDIITKNDFQEKLESFHTVKDLGKKMNVNIQNVNYRKILNEMIDERLMIQEALRIGLDETPDFIRSYNLSKLRIALDRLWKDEILKKIEISDEEIQERFIYLNESVRLRHIFTKDKSKGEKLLKALEEGADFAALAEKESDATEDDKKKGGDIGFKKRGELFDTARDISFRMKEGEISGLIKSKIGFHILKLEEKKPPEREISEKEREGIYRNIFNKKVQKRNEEYIASLREGADIIIEESAIDALKPDMKVDKKDSTIATVNGNPIQGSELLRIVKSSHSATKADKLGALDSLIRQKLLDVEAERRNYDNDEAFQSALSKIRRSHLLKLFKIRIIGGAVTLDDREIEDYYREHLDEFMESGKVRFKVIQLAGKEEADKAMVELEKGADFRMMAADISVNRSYSDKGDSGWVTVNDLDPVFVKKLDEMEKGGVYGPFEIKKWFVVIKLVGKKKGKPKPFDSVKNDIIITLKKQKYLQMNEEYMSKLRAASSIKINESVLSGFIKPKMNTKAKKGEK